MVSEEAWWETANAKERNRRFLLAGVRGADGGEALPFVVGVPSGCKVLICSTLPSAHERSFNFLR